MRNSTGWDAAARKAWIHSHGRLLSRMAIVSVIEAVVLPIVVLAFGLHYLSVAVHYPPVNQMHIALIVSSLLAVVGLLAVRAAWTTHAPASDLGIAAALVI